jgi:WD40 repeat protein/phage terminase small subunit
MQRSGGGEGARAGCPIRLLLAPPPSLRAQIIIWCSPAPFVARTGTEEMDAITAICVSPKKDLIAIAERGEKATISVYEVKTRKRKKVMTAMDVGSVEYVHMCFSADGKELLALGGEPDYVLVKFNWEKGAVKASCKASQPQNTPVYQASFMPQDPQIVCVCGHNLFRFYRIQDQNFKPMPNPMQKRDAQNYVCHAWVSDERVIVGTETGELLLVENFECKPQPLLNSPMDGNSINCVITQGDGRGFICAGDGGAIHIFERVDESRGGGNEREYYRRAGGFKLENTHSRIMTLALSPSSENVLAATHDAQLLSVPLSQAAMGGGDKADGDSKDNGIVPAAQPFHSSPIVGLDTCLRKPLVATCSADRSVRVWNYMDRNIDIHKTFPEEAFSVAFHPSGLHVLVGFSDKLRLMNLLIDDIRMVKEFPIKSCKECCFSNGGQYFAACNASLIQIFNSYTCEPVGNLRGHSGKVRSIYWTSDDSKIVSAGADGAVYEWKVKECKRDGERDNVLKSCQYHSVVCSADARSIFAVGSDKKLKEISDSQTSKEFYCDDCCLTQVALSHGGRMLFAATDTGAVRSYKFPLTGEFQSYEAHGGDVTRLRISYGDDYLFSVGSDACMYVWDIKDREGRVSKQKGELLPPAEEILITKSDLEEKTQRMTELLTKVDELTMQSDYQLRLVELNFQDRLKEVNDKYTGELEEARSKYDILLQEKNDQELDNEERVSALEEKQQDQLQQFEQQYQEKIMAEVERYQALQQEKELMNERWDEQNSLLVESHEQVVQQMTEEYESKLQALAEAVEQGKEDREDLIRQFEETKRQIEEDADREIEELKEKYEAQVNREREICLRLKGDNTLMRKKTKAMQHEITAHQDDIKSLFENEKELRKVIALNEKDIRGQRQEIKERDETIGDKEKRIFDLKRKNQELEKFKFVLDYKIKELKKQIEPKMEQIAAMKEQINKMDQELERYHKNNSNLELTISDLRLKLGGVQRELKSQRNRTKDAELYIARFKTEVHDVVQAIQDPHALKDGAKQLYHKYCQRDADGDSVAVEEDADVASEYARQRDYLEKTVNSLKRKGFKDTERHRVESMRIMQENVALIKEINELRREMKAMKAQAQAERLAGTSFGSSRGPAPQAEKELAIQREQIRQLRERIDQLETGRPPSAISSRPGSRERLPPMEGLPGEMMPMGLDGTEPPPPAAEPAPEAAPEPVAPEPETEPEA